MILKNLLTTTALTLAISAPVYAQSTDLEGSADTNAEISVEGMEMEGTAETDMTLEGEMDADVDAPMTAQSAPETELDAGVETTLMADGDMTGNAFSGMTVAEIVGLNVLSAEGEDVGEIDYILSVDGGYEAVIGIGGFLGLGEYTVALPLERFSMVDGELQLDAATEAELEAMPEIDESEIEPLDGDHVLS